MQFYIPYTHQTRSKPVGEPLLLYTCKLDQRELSHPRSVHSHHAIVELVYVLGGESTYEIAELPYPVTAGDLVIYNSDVVHNECRGSRQLPILCCAATGIQIPGLPPNCILPPAMSPVLHLGSKAPVFRTLMQALFDESSNRTPHTVDICQSLFLSLLHLTLGQIEERSFSPSSAAQVHTDIGRQIRAYVDEHITENLSAPLVAQTFGISPSYLARVFRRAVGCPLTAYLTRRKIGEAQTLLLTTGLSITEISRRVGYDNQSYFTKLFTQNIGIPPLRYRKMYRSITQDTSAVK